MKIYVVEDYTYAQEGEWLHGIRKAFRTFESAEKFIKNSAGDDYEAVKSDEDDDTTEYRMWCYDGKEMRQGEFWTIQEVELA